MDDEKMDSEDGRDGMEVLKDYIKTLYEDYPQEKAEQLEKQICAEVLIDAMNLNKEFECLITDRALGKVGCYLEKVEGSSSRKLSEERKDFSHNYYARQIKEGKEIFEVLFPQFQKILIALAENTKGNAVEIGNMDFDVTDLKKRLRKNAKKNKEEM